MSAARNSMVYVAGGNFRMGSADFYAEERPVREVRVDGFWIDEHPVTVGEFRRFIKDTGYVTVAERPLDPADYPEADPSLLVPGSLVFYPTQGPVNLDDYRAWWRYVPGASWERPEGPASDAYTRGRHPVIHVTHEDAAAYAEWAGKALPSEAEWEFAARGGLDGAVFCWGDEFMPQGKLMANTWHGQFPFAHDRPDEWVRTSPVGTYPPNGFGLHDMAGNVWEWTDDFFSTREESMPANPCCAPHNPRVSAPVAGSYIDDQPGAHIPRRVIKGGSHLCAPNYCLRYRPAARQGEASDTSTSHIGFRCVVRDG
ncbi:MAG: formylglycine-generating enzyme family protein [Solirubrobacterales bacterium]|nr:formylglycine-generating enzyme family protein [Solirubrobacterales bacterium]